MRAISTEPSSEAVAAILDPSQQQHIAISDWALAEFASLLARPVRTRFLSLVLAAKTLTLLKQDAGEAMMS